MFFHKMNINVKAEETQQRFLLFYQENIQAIYEDLEKVRKSSIFSLMRNIFCILCVIIIAIALFYYDILSVKVVDQQWFPISTAIFLLIAGGLIIYPFNHYNSITKSRAMKKILSFWGNFKYYNGRDIIGKDIIKKSELFGYFNSSGSDDAFCGNYKDVKIDVSEHNLQIKGNKGSTFVFEGAFIMLDFPQKLQSKTVVLSKGRKWSFIWNNPVFIVILPFALFPFFSIYYYYFTDPGVPIGLLFTPLPILLMLLAFWVGFKIYWHYHPKKATQKVELEGINFLRKWNVLTDNQVEARYILTPIFMEKMLTVKKLFYGRYIDFSFFDNKLLIAVHTRKDLFETTSLFTPALSYHKMREVVSQLQSIFAVIDIVLGQNFK